MKYFIYTVIFVSLVFIGFSATALDFQALNEGESGQALIVILSCLIVIVLMTILLISRKISKKQKA